MPSDYFLFRTQEIIVVKGIYKMVDFSLEGHFQLTVNLSVLVSGNGSASIIFFFFLGGGYMNQYMSITMV